MNTTHTHPHPSYDFGGRCRRRRRSSYPPISLAWIAATLSRELKANGRDRTANAYLTASKGITEFTGRSDLLLGDITAGLLCRYDEYLIRLGKEPNTVSFHMRNLRAIYNKAVRRELIAPPSESLFSHVHTGVYETRKRALSNEELHVLSRLSIDNLPEEEAVAIEEPVVEVEEPVAVETLLALDPDVATSVTSAPAPEATPATPAAQPRRSLLSETLYCTLLYFLFCFHARGMAFIDMAFLKKNSIRDGCIHYRRKKTGKEMSVKITAPMQGILDYFSSRVEDSPYLFPLIHPREGDERRQYETALTLQNRRLKVLGKIAGIRSILSTHVARHSWATVAKKKNVPLSVISECLGHRDERTTII
ncbi:MAG: site-specific integrase, partial [Dysgonamonadaceae bacterium]|nr:site-specific integrase [Dysgonamonadaceae bacterium]